MPSVFENMVASALPGFYKMFGLAAAYEATDGTVTTGLLVRIQRNEFHEVPRDVKAAGVMQTGEIKIQMSGSTGLAKPVQGGRFKVEDVEVWTIETPPISRNGEWFCTCQRAGNGRLMEKRGGGHA